MNKLLLFFVWITILIYAANAYMVIKTVKVKCEGNPDYLTNATCKLKAINRYKGVVNFDYYLKQILRNVSIQFNTYVQNDRNHFYPYVVTVKGNVCAALVRPKLAIISTVIKNYAAKYSNINHSCPYMGHIYGRDLWLDEKLLPTFIVPSGFYKATFEFLEGWPFISITNISAVVQIMDVRKDRYDKYNH